MRINTLLLACIGAAFLFLSSCGTDDEVVIDDTVMDDPVPEGYSLVWADEFNGDVISPDNWNFEYGDGTDYGLPPGWGNNELQLYTDASDNAGIVKLGDISALQITALTDGAGGYTSSKLTSQNKVSVRYGRVDAKAKMPQGQGIWPAIWMLGDNISEISWPGCGEIDIVEVLGQDPNTVYSTVHYTDADNSLSSDQGLINSTVDYSADFHIYSVEWTPEVIRFLLDDDVVHEVALADDMKEFQRSFYLIMNVAVGGYWPGEPDATTSFPQSMQVDYVRVYAQDGFEAPEAPALDIAEETIGQILQPSIADHAIQEGFDILGNLEVLVWGGGGEPIVGLSDQAVEGDSSLLFTYQGENWGGGYIKMEDPVDLSSYTNFKFSLQTPAELVDAEIKLESPTTNAAVYLANYTGTDVGNGFLEYSIPLADFVGLDVSAVWIPFAMWNPQNSALEFVGGDVHIDNIHFE